MTLTATNGAITVASGTGTIGISADAAATTVNIGTGAGVKTVTVGSTNSTSPTTIQSGSGALAITSTNGAITANSGTGTIGVSADATATTVNLATGAGVKTVTLGSTNSTSATTVQSGSGAIAITSANGTITANSGTGTIAVSSDAAATTVNFGTGAAAKAVTLGSTTTTSATTINAGSGNITMVGNVLKTTNPAFLAYLAVTAGNKTGSGTSYTLGTDALTEVFDRGTNFNTNGTFTAPVTGIYDLRAQVTLTGCTIATTFVISIVATSRTATYTFIKAAGAQDESVQVGSLFDMTATDTAHVTISVNGEAGDTVDILGAASLQTFFCGSLIA